jgi:homocysteine S-methyltransferase
MSDPLRPFIERRGAAILDGGLATELEARGLALDDPLWSARALIDAPELVAAVHRDYLEAGADVISTATYQATLPGLAGRGLSAAESRRVLLSGVTLARTERDVFWERHVAGSVRARPLVAASIGSYGAFLADGSEYRGEYGLDAAALAAWHRPRLDILEGSGADLLAFETIPSLMEVMAIVRALADHPGPPAWISFQARDSRHLADGSPVDAAAAAADRCARVVAVGVNCVAPALVAPLLTRLARATSKPLAVYPNRGDVWDPASRSWIETGSQVAFGSLALAWRSAGARLIGGCCRTTPADIRTIASALNEATGEGTSLFSDKR